MLIPSFKTAELSRASTPHPKMLPPDGRSPKKKWTSAFRVFQGVHRFKQPIKDRHTDYESHESTPSRDTEVVDPVYLALKQATGKYGSRRGSSAYLESNTPSPRNLSQVSLQDSGYVEMPPTRMQMNAMMGSTPQLENGAAQLAVTGRRRAPRLNKQMKSLSLDCTEMPPRIHAATRSPVRASVGPTGKMLPREPRSKLGSSDLSDWERSCSPCVTRGASRRSSASAGAGLSPGYIVIHEYTPAGGSTLMLGDRVHVVDNGDPDWMHGFKLGDRTERMISFPATCVSLLLPGEQPMKITQNVHIPEQKLRMYRDQVVFAQADSLRDGKVTVRTVRNAYAPCPLHHLALL